MMVGDSLLDMPEYQNATRQEQLIMFPAAMFHDVAKFSTTKVDPSTGDIIQPGHSTRGAIDARILLWDAGVPFDVREAICRIIKAHQVPFYAVPNADDPPPRSGKTPEFIVRELSWHVNLRLLAAVAEADMRGRICDDQQKVLDRIDNFRIKAMVEECYEKPKEFADAHTAVSYFRGANLDPGTKLYQNAGSEVIGMCGLPASGKDTELSKIAAGWPVISFDDAMAELGLRYGKNDGKAAHFAIDKATSLLREKRPFVWNATNINDLMRRKMLDLLYRYNAEVELVYLEKPRAEIMRRNTARDTTLTNKKIEAMLRKWDVPVPTEAHRVRYEC
jgi:predicted kinase